MQRRFYRIFLLIIIAIACFCGYKFYQQYQNKEQADHARINNILHPRPNKKQSTNNEKKIKQMPSKIQFSNNEWLIMGYTAYARHNYEQSRHVHTTAQLVKDIEEDLQSGALKAKREDERTYILSNKYGSVNGYVKNKEVKITGDGVTINSKASLSKIFAHNQEQVREMGQMIK